MYVFVHFLLSARTPERTQGYGVSFVCLFSSSKTYLCVPVFCFCLSLMNFAGAFTQLYPDDFHSRRYGECCVWLGQIKNERTAGEAGFITIFEIKLRFNLQCFYVCKAFCKCSPYSNKNGIERRTRDRPTESRNSFLLPIKIVLWRGEGMGTQNATIFHNKTTIFISRIHSTCHVKRNRLILFFAVPCFVCP